MKMRIAIAHHDPAMAVALNEHVTADSRLLILWSVATAPEAVERCRAEPPDLLLLELTGNAPREAADATRVIMQDSPCAILILCPASNGDIARAPYAALANGALDAVSETGFIGGQERSALAIKLGQLVRILCTEAAASPTPSPKSSAETSLLVIGASTGGPAVISTVLREIPKPLPVPCIVIQHIDSEFAPGMATWLQAETGHKCVLAEVGDTPQNGTVYLAAGSGHLVLDSHRFAYHSEPADTPYQPNIDEFFNSACGGWAPGCAVLMTGMGRDGARGLLALRKKGWTTIAQAPETCAVRGMPQAAVDLGAAQHILDPSGIGAMLRKTLRKANAP